MTHAEYAMALLLSASQQASNEWAIVQYFYAAVHAVNHQLYGGANVDWAQDHFKRELDMRGHRLLRTKFGAYRDLKRLSEDARYRPWLHPMAADKVGRSVSVAKDILRACGLT